MIDENRKKALTVISLGAGVQSSTMALMAADGELPKPDCAIFADTGNEPKAVYTYLDFLKKFYLIQFIRFQKVILQKI
jgi:3'-phosphoadenosine 5'-phosphosulfate sulfotransferase (PAPS reductase)/FAD synthetase